MIHSAHYGQLSGPAQKCNTATDRQKVGKGFGLQRFKMDYYNMKRFFTIETQKTQICSLQNTITLYIISLACCSVQEVFLPHLRAYRFHLKYLNTPNLHRLHSFKL